MGQVVRFIHAADAHIDSPLVGLETYEGMPVSRLRNATRGAFENLIRFALDQRVDFVIIAGDLFDGTWRDMKTGLWTAGQFRRLQHEHIDVYLVRGNHDALSQVRPAITWPANVHEFAVRKPESFLRADLGVAIHGQSFPNREVLDDLASTYPAPEERLFNIGVLHTSLTGSAAHDTYAPTSEAVLVGRGYQYWALGHIHRRQVICKEPYIAFSGNTQGRHIHESGAKGCLLVTVEDKEIQQVEFHATDVLRWQRVDIELGAGDAVGEMLVAVRDKLAAVQAAADGSFTAIRLLIQGPCAAHNELVHRGRREEAIAEIRNLAGEMEESVCVEEIRLNTSAPVDIRQLRAGHDLMGELLRRIERLARDDAALVALADSLTVLEMQAAGLLHQADIDLKAPANLSRWLRETEGLLVAHLLEADR